MKYVGLIGEHMEPSIMNQAKAQLVRHEGLRLKPYRCTAGKLTIGVGRNLEDKGISQQEAYELLENDIRECEVQLLTEIPDIYLSLDINRKVVLINMCFNLGIKGLMGFKNTLAFIAARDWERAANNMLASRWAKQVGRRAIELAEIMRKGE
jgi:lysozyme